MIMVHQALMSLLPFHHCWPVNGGATVLAEAGTAPHLIQTAGSSNTFNHYVRKNPFLFEALLIGHLSLHSHTSV